LIEIFQESDKFLDQSVGVNRNIRFKYWGYWLSFHPPILSVLSIIEEGLPFSDSPHNQGIYFLLYANGLISRGCYLGRLAHLDPRLSVLAASAHEELDHFVDQQYCDGETDAKQPFMDTKRGQAQEPLEKI
jgi:hypothetical protein